MLAEKIARELLADQGLKVIWRLHADAATLDQSVIKLPRNRF